MVEAVAAAGQRAFYIVQFATTSVVAVTDPTRKTLVFHLCGKPGHIAQAPIFLGALTSPGLDRICEARNYTHVAEYVENFLLSAVDTAIMMQNGAGCRVAGLACATSARSATAPRRVIDLLHLPRLVFLRRHDVGWLAASPMLVPCQPAAGSRAALGSLRFQR